MRKHFGFHLFCYIGTREERGKKNCTKIINTRIPVIKPSLLLSFQMNVCLSISFPFCIFSAQVSYTKHKNFIFLEQCFCSQGKHQKTRGFQGDRKIPVAWNGLNIVGFFCFYFFIFYLFFFVIGYLCRWCFRWVRFTYLKSLIQQQGCNVLDLSHFMRMFLIMSLLSNILQ